MIIKNGKVVTWTPSNEILEGVGIYIQHGIIREIGEIKLLLEKYPDEPVLDAGDQYVMPGNICAHTHFYGAYARGLGLPGVAPGRFIEILEKLWWSLDKSLTHEDVYYSALVCLIDAIRHGTTCLFDHHASPNAISGSLERIAEAVSQSGIRTSLCYEVTDRDGEVKTQQGINENIAFIQFLEREKGLQDQIHAMFGLHASFTVSDATLQKCRDAIPESKGFHVHLAEDLLDQYDSMEKYGKRIVERFFDSKILGPNTIAAHGVHIDAREMEILAESGTWLTHQPRSNMNNGVGIADIEAMLRLGVKVCLGNDGFSNAMWEEWKMAYLLPKSFHRDPRRMNGMKVAEMAIFNNSRLASHMFGKDIGIIRQGAVADLIFVDYHPFTPVTPGNLPWHILFGFHESLITTTIVNGRVLMKNKEIISLDEEKITSIAMNRAPVIWERYIQNVNK